MMDSRVIRAVRCGTIAHLQELYADNYNLLNNSSTPYGNNALHLAVICRREELAKELCSKCPPLLSAANADGNTPLLLAAATGLVTLVKDLLASPVGDVEEGKHMLMATNKTGNNALHEALRNGHSEVALELLRAEPELAGQVNNNGESPLCMACYRSMEEVVNELLKLPAATDEGPNGETALYAAVEVGHSGLVEALLRERPCLVKVKDSTGSTPLHYASRFNELAVVKLLLSWDASLAYVVDKDGDPPITSAVKRDCVPIVEEFVQCCPDSALIMNKDGNTSLHNAVDSGSVEVVKYILRTPELRGLINQPNNAGDVPLHLALRGRKRMICVALLQCESLDRKAVKIRDVDAFDFPLEMSLRRGSTNSVLKSTFLDQHLFFRWNIHEDKFKNQKRDVFWNYVNNCLVVATLMATVTFAAAFTAPGGYQGNQDAPDVGLPILARKAAFKAFLISDTIAMCASMAVAFLCIFAPWVDDEFLTGYVENTSKLLVFGFGAMSVAFATALYVVVAPGSLWLAAIICVLCCSIPYCIYGVTYWSDYDTAIFMSSMPSMTMEKIFKRRERQTYGE